MSTWRSWRLVVSPVPRHEQDIIPSLKNRGVVKITTTELLLPVASVQLCFLKRACVFVCVFFFYLFVYNVMMPIIVEKKERGLAGFL